MKRRFLSFSYRLSRRIALAAIGIPLLTAAMPCYGQDTPASGSKAPASAPRTVSESDIAELVQKTLSQRNIPGVSVAVVRDGKTILTRGYGLANVETKAPATEQTAYQLASVTKQFTAAGVLLLVEEGKIKLDEPFVTYLPDLPAAWKERWKEVRIRHLLNHTSGIESYTSLPDFGKTMRKDYTHRELIGLVADKPLRWKPGEKWDYNNTGYYLLGMVIEKVSGKSYNDFLTERIFQPLGMKDTRVNDLQAVIPNRATGYGMGPKGLRNGEYTSPTQPYAAGALISTVADMAKWAEAVDAGKILKAESWKEAWTPTKLADGKTEGYGFGWSLGTANGHPTISHGGGIPGFSTNILRLPADKLTVVVLTNLEGADSGSLSRKIAALYVPDSADSALKPIADPDPMLTKRLRVIVENAAKGEAKESDFAPEMWKALYPDRLQQGKAALSQLGELKSFELLVRQEGDDLLRLGYRATFGTTPMRVSVGLTKEGKIAGMGFRPE
jgi:CubicO group peptidase (beta-lactamase class C family)